MYSWGLCLCLLLGLGLESVQVPKRALSSTSLYIDFRIGWFGYPDHCCPSPCPDHPRTHPHQRIEVRWKLRRTTPVPILQFESSPVYARPQLSRWVPHLYITRFVLLMAVSMSPVYVDCSKTTVVPCDRETLKRSSNSSAIDLGHSGQPLIQASKPSTQSRHRQLILEPLFTDGRSTDDKDDITLVSCLSFQSKQHPSHIPAFQHEAKRIGR